MALTIVYTPPAYSSIQDDLIYTVSETVKTADPVTYPNYKFIADVYVGGVLVARVKKVPDPVTGIGIFNVSQIVRNYLKVIFDPTTGTLVSQIMGPGIFNLSVQMKFGEEYAFTSYYNVTDDIARTFYNNYNGRLKGQSTSLSPFLNTIASNRPVNSEVLFSSSYCFIPYFPTTTNVVHVIVTPYGDGIQYEADITPADANNLLVLNVGPQNLIYLQPGTITPATTTYSVQVGTLTYWFKVTCEPTYQPYTLHFLNQYGGFETKIFSKVSHNTIDIERKDFGKLRYQVGSDGVPFYKTPNKVYNESRSTYSVQYVEKMSLNSDLLPDDEYIWLQELIVSPMVYLEDGGYFFPCIIAANNYEPKKNVNEDLSNLTINIEFGTQLNAQYR